MPVRWALVLPRRSASLSRWIICCWGTHIHTRCLSPLIHMRRSGFTFVRAVGWPYEFACYFARNPHGVSLCVYLDVCPPQENPHGRNSHVEKKRPLAGVLFCRCDVARLSRRFRLRTLLTYAHICYYYHRRTKWEIPKSSAHAEWFICMLLPQLRNVLIPNNKSEFMRQQSS